MDKPTENRSPERIGGWLMLILIGLFVSPIVIGMHLYKDFLPIFSDGTWEVLTDPSSDVYHHLWAPLIVFEVTGNVIVLLLGLIALYFFLRRSRHTPRASIAWLVVSLVFVVSDFFLADLIPLVAEQGTDLDTVKEVVKSVASAVIWVPYFLFSKRVRETFTR
jgi:hypothetical protein